MDQQKVDLALKDLRDRLTRLTSELRAIQSGDQPDDKKIGDLENDGEKGRQVGGLLMY